MASHTISGQPWPNGTTVSVYSANGQPAGGDGTPLGAAVTSAAVSGGAVTFSGLSENVRYVAYAAGVSKRFLIPQQDPMDARSLRVRVDELEGDTLPAVQGNVGDVVIVAGAGGAVISDAAAVQTALNAYPTRRIVLDGAHNFTGAASVAIPDYGKIALRPGARITKSSSDGVHAFTAWGTLGADVNLTANAVIGATSLAFNTAGFSAGDYLMLRSNVDWSASEPGAPQGERVQIRTVTDGANAELTKPLYDSYTTANVARVAKVTRRVGIELDGLEHVNDTPGIGLGGLLNARYADLTIKNCKGRQMTGACLYLESCTGTVQGGDFTDGYTREDAGSGAYGYGIDLVGATQEMVVSSITGRNGRTLVTTNGSPRGGVPRNNVIDGGEATGRYTIAPWHTHYCAEYIRYSDCGFSGRAGTGTVHIAGKNCSADDCHTGESTGCGIFVEGTAVGTTINGGEHKNLRDVTNGIGVWNIGSKTTVNGVYVETVGNCCFYTEGADTTFTSNTGRPGTSKSCYIINDPSDTWLIHGAVIIDALTGINFITPASPTQRAFGVVTSNVSSVTNKVGAVASQNATGGFPTFAKGTAILNAGAAGTGGLAFGSATQYGSGSAMVFPTIVRVGEAVAAGTSYIEGFEQSSDPSAPGADRGRIFFKDNGAGKTQLCVRFPTGATQVIATEP